MKQCKDCGELKALRARARELNAAPKSKNQHVANAAQARRNGRIKLATPPPWFVGLEAEYMLKVCAIRDFLSEKTGVPHEVDHLHPISGPNFCGLHAPSNIRVVPAFVNLAKGSQLPVEHRLMAW